MNRISIYSHHGGGIAIQRGDRYYNLEFERLFKKRYISMLDVEDYDIKLDKALETIDLCWDIKNDFSECIIPKIWEDLKGKDVKCNEIIKRKIKSKKFIECNHHEAHAASAFYQSPFKEALIISFDGGGNDGRFIVFKGDKNGIKKIHKLNVHSMGFNYRKVAQYIKEIPKDRNVLSYPGKLMALCSYGAVNKSYKSMFLGLYKDNNQIDLKENSLGPILPYDLVATNQNVFEEVFWDRVKEFITELPICLSGGCALNILNNTALGNKVKNDIYVPPNVDDSGIAIGQLWKSFPPKC